MSTPTPRTIDEVADRLRRIRADELGDIFNWRAEVLAEFLDAERLRELDLIPLEVALWRPRPIREAAQLGAEYLAFAFGKALDHRGLSAARSVEKLGEYAWLQGGDDVVAAMAMAPYRQYGVPKLLAYPIAFDLPVPDDERLRRMGLGEPCVPDCPRGCGA